MNRYLEQGYQFHIANRNGVFTILELLGVGATCAVYRAEFTDERGNRTEHLLKEYHPLRQEISRGEDGCLIPADEELFAAGIRRFCAGYEKQLAIRRISDLKNATGNIQGIYQANATQYIDMTCFHGQTYEKVRERSLYDLLRRMKALTEVIGGYHKAGFLHLDIKPENFLTIPETCELAILFDFDSVTEKSEVRFGGRSYSEAWAAPEQYLPGYAGKICEATDLFAVGEMIFFALFGRHSDRNDRSSLAEYSFDASADIFKNTDPRVLPQLGELLRRTICSVAKKRYQTAEELAEKLEELIKLADPRKPYIGKRLPALQKFFVGRDKETDAIHALLAGNDTVFLSGIGGIGKSELAKQYAHCHAEDYDAVVFAPYPGSVTALIGDDFALPIQNFAPYPKEAPEDYCVRKLKKLQDLCSDRTLIVVDNLDNTEDENIPKLLEIGCKLLITTRGDLSQDGFGAHLCLDALSDREAILAIFQNYYLRPLTEEEYACVSEIIDAVGGHTMTVELLAKQMLASRVKPDVMLKKLRESGLGGSGKEKVRVGKDRKISERNAYAHLQALFDLSGMTEEELHVLSNLSLLPHTGIPAQRLHDWCGLQDYDTLNSLAVGGWVRWERESDMVSLHPVVRDIALKEAAQTPERIFALLENSVRYADNAANGTERSAVAGLLLELSRRLDKAGIETGEAAGFWNCAAVLYQEYGYLKEAIFFLEKALPIRKTQRSAASEAELAAAYCDLCSLYAERSDFAKAEEYGRRSLRIRRRLFGEKHRDTATSYNNLGSLYEDMGHLERAEEAYRNALNIRREVLGEEHRETAVSYNNLGSLHLKKGDWSNAAECCMKALDIREALCGEMHKETAISYQNMGALAWRVGRLDLAEELFRKALRILQTLCGDGSLRAAGVHTNLGAVYEKQSRRGQAAMHYETALRIFEDAYGENHSQTIQTRNFLEELRKKR